MARGAGYPGEKKKKTTNEPNFKIVCNCVHELLNVFEDSVQREHTISVQIMQMSSVSSSGVATLGPVPHRQ